MAVSLSLAATLGACGGEREFSAEEFVEEANANGAALELGAALESTRADAETFAVSLSEGEREPAHEQDDAGHAHGGGSLTITADAEAGLAEYERCEAAPTLLCFRASNAVLLLEDSLPADELAPIEAAFRAMATD